jgi:Domain of unknown function (DUF4328)
MSAAGYEPATPGVTEASLRKSRVLAYLAMGALALCAVLGVIGVVSDYSYGNLIGRILNGGNVTLGQANAADHRVQTIAWTEIGLYLVTAAIFIAWFHDAYKNVGRLGVNGLRWSSGWAIGAWFVPFLNLVRPKAILNDIWRGSDPKARVGSTLGWDDSPPALYQVWWGLWILAALFDRIAYLAFNRAETPDAIRTGTHLLMASDVFEVVVAVLAILVVRSLTARQRERAAEVAGRVPAGV